ncbi:hypothetical protein Ccrd_023688 [Cynara cardunculus var. scolymus]|uniref:Uncharacterized protein n=1 Tax=Cynara cardunculus var. scolymus TaxID=59895 RepID=A0A103XWD1_CYNCS|nr:hypothetical protein Ccrd_023688 [Cynara cardunculus var. scolymus]
MVMLCFVLDLRTLSPPLLRDLKQLANFYAISSPRGHKSISISKSLLDRIGLCYVFRNRISCSTEQMKVAYRPSGDFSLRDFHHAVNNLPSDGFLPELNNHVAISCCADALLASVLNDKVLYSWGRDCEDVGRKVIVISSCLLENLDAVTKKTLIDAADKCISVDFVLLVSSGLGDLSESINNFLKNICDLENCSFHNHLPGYAKVLCALVKKWLQDLRDEAEHLQARVKFKRNLLGSLNQICCNLFPSFDLIIDEFKPCQACRCHGYPLDDEHGNGPVKSTSCPVTGNELGTLDLIENSLKVGEQTVLLMPSFHYYTKLQHVTTHIDFNVINRTNLASLSEGKPQTQFLLAIRLIVGTPFVVGPSTSLELDDTDQMELNNQGHQMLPFLLVHLLVPLLIPQVFLGCEFAVFQGLCSALHFLDQGLVCSSRCNTETMKETPFQCYYILLPSDNGVMLLRRLAGSEEVIPIPDVSQSFESTEAKDVRDSINVAHACTSNMPQVMPFLFYYGAQIEERGYNPILHERGFHQRLNVLVKESLHFGSLPTKSEESPPEPTSTREDSLNDSGPSKQTMSMVGFEEEIPQLEMNFGPDKITARITEEWEQLIVNEIPKINSPTCVSKSKLDPLALSPLDSNKPLDERTSRILERLEVPRKLKAKVASPVIITSSSAPIDACMLTKKPLIPFQPTQTSDTGTIASQPMRPNFQRLKRKHR